MIGSCGPSQDVAVTLVAVLSTRGTSSHETSHIALSWVANKCPPHKVCPYEPKYIPYFVHCLSAAHAVCIFSYFQLPDVGRRSRGLKLPPHSTISLIGVGSVFVVKWLFVFAAHLARHQPQPNQRIAYVAYCWPSKDRKHGRYIKALIW